MNRMRLLLLMFAFLTGFVWAEVNPVVSPYGINVHLAGNETLDMVKAAGIKWIRIDINWHICEPRAGDYVFGDVDRVVDYAARNGLSVLAVIGATPGWANNGKGLNYPSDDVADWKGFVRIVVQRYKSKIKYWNIWNEPNVPDFFAMGKDTFVERVFIPASRAIHNQDPGAFVVGPELAHLTASNQEWFLWMKYILTQAKEDIDVVSHHLYDSRGGVYVYELLESGEPLIPSVLELVEECGMADRPFWLTETGWSTRTISEEVQGQLYLEILQLQRSKNSPDKIFFYMIQDDPDPEVAPWGILRLDGTPKPAYHVYRDFIAGKYPQDGLNPIPEEEKEDCYAERMIPTARGEALLTSLRGVRDFLLQRVPGGRSWVRDYYRWSSELYRLSLSDSRLCRSGKSLLIEAASCLAATGRDFRLSPISIHLKRSLRDWVGVALQQEMAGELRLILQEVSRIAGNLSEDDTVQDLIRMHAFTNREIRPRD